MKASEWVAKQDAGLTVRDQSGFLDWLSEAPIHSEYFAEQLQAWEDFDLLEQWRPRHSDEPNPDLLALPRRHHPVRHFTVWGAIAASFLILASSLLLNKTPEHELQKVRYLSSENVAKGFERHVLEDGSEIQMNRGSQVSVDFSPNRRVAKLYSGEAYFTVAKDPERPFFVEADGVEVRAIGTAFSVEKSDQGITVLVTEGHVQFQTNSSQHRYGKQPRVAADKYDLFVGQRSVIDLLNPEGKPVIDEVSLEQIENEHAWKDRIIEFNGAPLHRVVHELNLRNEVQIQILDSDLRDRKITVTIRPENVDGFVELLEVALEITAVHTSPTNIVLKG